MGLLRTRYTPLRQNSDHGSAAFRTTDEGHEEDPEEGGQFIVEGGVAY